MVVPSGMPHPHPHPHPLTIGQLAKAASVPTSSVRYYERRGLLCPEARTGSGYRLYSALSLKRLRFIRAAKAAGFTLANIAALLDASDASGDVSSEVRVLIEQRLAEVSDQIESLHHAKATLTDWLDTCQQRSCPGQCAVLDGLAEHPG